MDTSVDTAKYRLVVTGPERHRLYDHFCQLFWGRDGVEVILDRRISERRRDHARTDLERRTRERRRSAPEWVVPPS
jgi:hypothetical protein